jgi:hypothetical protein
MSSDRPHGQEKMAGSTATASDQPLDLRIDTALRHRFPELSIEQRVAIRNEIFQVAGPDFSRFRDLIMSAGFVDEQRWLAFQEYLRRRAATKGAMLTPDDVEICAQDFLRLPADYVAQLSMHLPPLMPPAMQAGMLPGMPPGQTFPYGPQLGYFGNGSPYPFDPTAMQPRRRWKLWPTWGDTKRELGRGTSYLLVAILIVTVWTSTGNEMIAGGLGVALVAILLWAFNRKQNGGP